MPGNFWKTDSEWRKRREISAFSQAHWHIKCQALKFIFSPAAKPQMNQIMKTGFFGGGGSDAGGAISGAAYLHTIGKTNISSINRNEAIYTFIYIQMCWWSSVWLYLFYVWQMWRLRLFPFPISAECKKHLQIKFWTLKNQSYSIFGVKRTKGENYGVERPPPTAGIM